MRNPIKTQEIYERTLNSIGLLLQKQNRVDGRAYLQLITSCILIDHYQRMYNPEQTPSVLKYKKGIKSLLKDEKVKRMLNRIGLHIVIDKKNCTCIDQPPVISLNFPG